MPTIEQLLQKLEADGNDIWIGEPQSEARIAQVEERLGLRLPPSYRTFVARFGGLTIGDVVISGICEDDPLAEVCGAVVGDTLRFRAEHGLPMNLLVVEPNDDAPYCLDANRADAGGEFPIVCYELHSGHLKQIATSFDAWLRESRLGPLME